MFNLEHSPQFQNDYKQLHERISKIQNLEVKLELERLLEELKKVVKKISFEHNQIGINNRLSVNVTDVRSELANLRRLIDKKITENS